MNKEEYLELKNRISRTLNNNRPDMMWITTTNIVGEELDNPNNFKIHAIWNNKRVYPTLEEAHKLLDIYN